MDFEGVLLNNRYRILQFIGEGGMSRVYKAEDIENNTFTAVKFLKERVTSSNIEDLIRTKKELEIVSRLNNPGIARVFGSGEFKGKLFYIMEMLDGENLEQYIQRKVRLNWDEIAGIFYKLVVILDFIHRCGIIHKDIKPGNFFVTGTENDIQIKLLDFGMAHIMELGEIKCDTEIAGTFGYMSPEATGLLHGSIDERSDLYSLGVIFYQLLTGELPFKAKDVGKLLHQQAASVPADPSGINREIPPILEKITMKLLVKDPDSRYQSAKGLLFDIDRYRNGDRDFFLGEGDRKLKLTYHTKLVGREHEIEKIKVMLRNAQGGKGSICFIKGEAGSGKSRLVEEFRSYAYKRNILFLGSRCLNHENKTPYQPFKDLIDEYVGVLEKSGFTNAYQELGKFGNITANFGEILVRLNPRIRRFIGEPKAMAELEPERENRRFLQVVSDFFCSIYEGKNGGILFLDDLQWMDAGSAGLLQEIAGKIDKTGLLVLGTYRGSEAGKRHGVENVIEKLKQQACPLEEIRLERLDDTAVKKLTAGILGEEEENVSNLSGYLFERSAGNPLFAINILRELVENNMVVRNGEGRFEDINESISMQVPESMLNVIMNRIGRLDGLDRGLLCKAAAIGREFDIELLYNMAGCSYEELVGIIDNAVSMQLLEKSPGKRKLLFTHDRIRDVFYLMPDEAARRKIHLEIARTIEELNRDNMERVVYELTHHYIEAGDGKKTLEYTIPAGDKAKESYANEDAVKFYKIALDLLESKGVKDGPDFIRVSENLIEIYLLIGRVDDAICMSGALLPILETPISKARVYKKIGIAYFKKGDWKKCEGNIAMGLKLLGERIPIKKAGVFVSLVGQLSVHLLHGLIPARIYKKSVSQDLEEKKEIIWSYYTLNWMYGLSDIFKFLRSAIRSLNLSEIRIGPSRELGTSLSQYAGLCMTFSLFERGLRFHQKALEIRREQNDKWGEAQTFQFIGYNQNWKGEYAQGIKCFEKSIQLFRETGDLWEEGLSLVGLTGILIYTNVYEKGIHNCRQYMEQSSKMNNTYGVNVARESWARLLIETGAFEDAEELLQSAVLSACDNNIMILYCLAHGYLGLLYMEKCQYSQAVESLALSKELYLKNNFLRDPLLQIFPHLADAYVKKLQEHFQKTGIKPTGKEIRTARLLCSDALKKTKRWISHYSTANRAAAGFYALTGKTAKAERLFRSGMECSKRLGQKYEEAKGHFEYGMFLQNEGRRQEALENFQKAYELFREIGAKAYVKRCETILAKDEGGEKQSDGLTARDRLRSERRMNMVLAAGRYISSILDPDELLEKIMAGVVELVGAERGVLLLYPEEGVKKLQAKVFYNVYKEMEWDDGNTISSSIISKVEEEKTPLLISDALSEEEFKNRSSVILNAVKSVICVPITVKGELLGVIYLDNNLINGLFSEEDLEIVSILAGQAGVSIQNAGMYSNLKDYLDQIERSKNEIAEWNRKLEQRVAERTEELNRLNVKLARAVEQLKGHAATVEELAVARERNRFAMDAHDHLGHTLTLLVKLLEYTRMTCLNAPEKMDLQLEEAGRIARIGMEELRASIKGLLSEDVNGYNLNRMLGELAENFKASGINVEICIEKSDDLGNDYINCIYNICIEAATNAIKHGKARNISFILKREESKIKLVIIDDGCGCIVINKGFGMTGMEKRINALNGIITFNSDGESGFIINAEIPWKGAEQ